MVTRFYTDRDSYSQNGCVYYHYKGVEIYGLSTDEMPMDDILNATPFYEMDTQKVFLFDAENNKWLEQ